MYKQMVDGIGAVYIVTDADDFKQHTKQKGDEDWPYPFLLVDDDGSQLCVKSEPTEYPIMYVAGSIPMAMTLGNSKTHVWLRDKIVAMAEDKINDAALVKIFLDAYKRTMPKDFEA